MARNTSRCMTHHACYTTVLTILLMTVFKTYAWSGSCPENFLPARSTSRESLLDTDVERIASHRRRFLSSLVTISASSFSILSETASASLTLDDLSSSKMDPRALAKVTIAGPAQRLGLELYDTVLRGKPIVVVRNNRNSRLATTIRPGMILLDYDSAAQVQARIQNGPWPIELTFWNLAAAGDAFNDMGESMVTPRDALELAQKTEDTGQATPSGDDASSFQRTVLSRPPALQCAIESRRGDVLEIDYEARMLPRNIDSQDKPIVYDASYMRGTGQPYQLVLGSGDMLPGVDQGLYDMCPGEVRILRIPPRLAYGRQGNKLFQIPPDTPLEWKVELISIDGTIRKDNNLQSRDEREGRALY